MNEYNFYHQIVAIFFSSTMLEQMKDVLPEVPTAHLGSVNQSNFTKAGVDTSMGVFSTRFNELYLRDIGFIG